MSEENRQSSYPDSTTGFGGDINSNDTYEKPYDQETAAGYGGDNMCQETAAGYAGGDDMCQETAAGYGGDYSCMNEKQTTTEDGYGQDSCGGGVDYYFEDKPAGKSHEDFEKEKKHHKHLQQIGELGTAAAGAYALYEKHEAKKDPEHAHEHKIEEEVAVAAAVGSGGFALHEHHEKEEAKKDEEEAEGHKKHHFFNDLVSLITTNI
ncbi:unnamed protein product [Cuscuta epithymum]|uniref:Uncharacterized protein n=1 Tax=Cuscuta epithymum TaxID=186058 RepID=A0AAV0EYK8_9ASTE|nr:unnamed protein product [Cuscuta epithymum]